MLVVGGHGEGVVRLGLLEEVLGCVRPTVDQRPGQPSMTAATSSPDSVLWVSRAWATASTSRRFSASSCSACSKQRREVLLDALARASCRRSFVVLVVAGPGGRHRRRR